MSPNRRLLLNMLPIFVALSATALSQSLTSGSRPLPANVIVPQARAFRVGARGTTGDVQITNVVAGVVIVEQVATTTLEIGLNNPTGQLTDAELLVPVPDGAVVRGFAFDGSGTEPMAAVLPKAEAKCLYNQIVAKTRDPALLEFAGCNLIRSSVFPVPARGTQKLRLTYEHVLPRDAGRVDYVLPRSESLGYHVPWSITVKVKSAQPLSTLYSPSHPVETTRSASNVISARLASSAAAEPGPFRLSYLLAQDGVSASLLAYPDALGTGGYFLLLAGLPADLPAIDDVPRLRRDVTLVLDRSGSMRGEKFQQARAAARQVLDGLADGEFFNIIVYNDAVDLFSSIPVVKAPDTTAAARAFLDRQTAGGGTNIYAALTTALRGGPTDGVLPLVLFLTDGLPTVGVTSEAAIRKLATHANPRHCRIFTFGVGVDVNTPLLEKLASNTRAVATFVLPGENIEVAVTKVFRGLDGPVLADASLTAVDEAGQPVAGRVQDMIPAILPDLFAGDQLTLLGRYTGSQPLHLQLHGNYLGQPRTFRFKFTLDGATTRNAFVPRLWASRRIAILADAIRQMGADPTAVFSGATPSTPRLNELTSEILRLSTEFGVLTEYTAFLAHEGTDLSNRDAVLAQASENFQRRAVAVRTGLGSVSQSKNLSAQAAQPCANARNSYYDENMNRVSVSAVQQVSDRAFFRRGNRWIDSTVISAAKEPKPERVITFGSDEFYELAGRLAAEGREGCLALDGEILLRVGDQLVLVKSATQP